MGKKKIGKRAMKKLFNKHFVNKELVKSLKHSLDNPFGGRRTLKRIKLFDAKTMKKSWFGFGGRAGIKLTKKGKLPKRWKLRGFKLIK